MASLPPVTNLLAFEAVARRRSFAVAAAELHLTASAISHQVARLESDLGVKLFERSAHGVRLSVAGEQYLERVAGALKAIASATDDLRQGVGNSLYVHSAPTLASPAFIREHRLKRIAQLLDVPLIQSNVSVVQWSDWLKRFADLRAPDRYSLRFDRAQMSLDAATQGLGVALESATNAEQHLAEGKLKPVFGLDKAIKVKAHFAVYPARHARRPPVEAFLAWIHGEASRSGRRVGQTVATS
jgi:DNA-binding transcriptional LysR family regulator